ncbi:insulinase family protein [Candidatus Woesearchaeota archaeon]|nr:insulinase family protein [Candidatus Woesearchaeota archaeon]
MVKFNGDYKEYKLDNGLVIALQNTPTQTVAAKLRVNYGSSHERDGEEGMAHFLEHCLVTGGSEKFDPLTADKIRGSFGYFNACTNIGRTFFVGNMLSEDIFLWIDYNSDHLFNPLFNEERVNGERERVLREISDIKTSPKYPATIEFNSLFYRRHPFGKPTMGKEDVIKSATLEDIKRFHRKGYHPNNIDLIVVGGLPGDIEGIINKHFGSLPIGENTRRSFPRLEPLSDKVVLHRPAPGNFNFDNPNESSAQILLSFMGVVDGHEDEYAIRTMGQILGSGTDSLLYQNLGLKRGLAYSTDVTIDSSYNTGKLSIESHVPANRIDEAIDALFEVMGEIKTQKVSSKNVDRVRRSVKYNLANAFESNEGLVSAIELKLDEGLTPKEVIERYDEVSPERVMEVANKYLPDKENGKYILYIRDPLKKD